MWGLFARLKEQYATDRGAVDPIKDKWLTLIVGGDTPRGCGKTTLAAHLATMHMVPPLRNYDVAKCRAEIAALRAGGWANLEFKDDVRHLVYVVDDIFTSSGMGYEPLTSLELKFDELGLHDGEHKVAHVLPYSIVVCPEVQGKLDCRKSMTDGPEDYLLRLIELQRKFGVRMIADAQLYESIEKRLRKQADLIIEVQKQTHQYDKYDVDQKVPIETTWHCIEFDGARNYERHLEKRDASLGRVVTYVHKGNIFDCVDSFAGKERFLDGMGNNSFDATTAQPTGNDMTAMLERCRRFPLTKPSKKKKEERTYGAA